MNSNVKNINKKKNTLISRLSKITPYQWFNIVVIVICFIQLLSILLPQVNIYADPKDQAQVDLESAFKTMFNSVYSLIFKISTAAGAVCIAVAAFLMFFSSDGKTVDSARGWIKRIVIAWLIINCVGAIMAFLEKNITGFSWDNQTHT